MVVTVSAFKMYNCICCCRISIDLVLCEILFQTSGLTLVGSKFSKFLGGKFSSMTLSSFSFLNMPQIKSCIIYEVLGELEDLLLLQIQILG